MTTNQTYQRIRTELFPGTYYIGDYNDKGVRAGIHEDNGTFL